MAGGIEPKIVSGSELDKVETIEKVKDILIEFLRGYPIWRFWGIIEGRFEKDVANAIIKELERHNILEVSWAKEGQEKTFYSLTPEGVKIATSLSNRSDSKRVLYYAQETHKFNRWIKWLTIGLFIIGALQLLTMWGIIP
jgi:hypothetical protein